MMKKRVAKGAQASPVVELSVIPPSTQLPKKRVRIQEYRYRLPTERKRVYQRNLDRRMRPLNKLAVINVLTNGEGTCRHCGHGDIDVLCLDHVNNDGAKQRLQHRTNRMTGGDLYRWLIRTGYAAAALFQVLCANCNLKKEVLRQRALSQ